MIPLRYEGAPPEEVGSKASIQANGDSAVRGAVNCMEQIQHAAEKGST